MKTLKIGMFAAALLLVLAGCKNAIATPADPKSFAYDVDEYDTAGTGYQFKVNSVGAPVKVGDTDDYLVTIKFNKTVAKEGLQEGVTFSKLTNADDGWKMPKKNTLTAELLNVAGQEAQFKLNLKDVKDLYVYITASKVKAKNGAHLNEDGDKIFGESGDDDYASHKVIGVTGITKGNVDYDKATGTTNTTLPTPTVSFGVGEKAEQKLLKKVTVADTGNNLANLFKDNGYPNEPNEKDEKFKTFASLLNTHLKIEQYDWTTGKWDNISASFKVNSAGNGWEADIALKPYRYVRYRWEKLNELKMTSHKYGYDIRYYLMNAEKPIIVGNHTTTGSLTFDNNYVLATSNVTKDISTSGIATLTLSAPNYNNVVYNESTQLFDISVSAANPEAGKKSLFKGFDMTKVKTENFKFFDNNGKSIKVKEIVHRSSDVTTYPSASDVLIFVFEDPTIQASNVYISPDVQMAAFTGSTSDGKSCNIPALSVITYEPTDDPNALKGWAKL